MLEVVMEVLNSARGGEWLRALKVLFLAFMAIGVMALLTSPVSGRVVRGGLWGLRLGVAGILLGILGYQATWQVGGHQRPEFVRFMRRYNRRPNVAETQVMRGPILDRRGMVLAAPVPGDLWGRRYPLGEAGVHPIGYFNSHHGLTGVERAFDPELSGYAADGGSLRREMFAPRASEGGEVQLTLDARLQQLGYELMDGRRGAVVVMRPGCGSLLALVSSPGFDPYDPGKAVGSSAPAFNRAVQGRYPPGSVFKILVAGMALGREMRPVYDCPAAGYIAAPSTPAIRDSEYYAWQRRGATWRGWGRMGLQRAFVHSSNVYFAQLGVNCGVESFNTICAQAQIGEGLLYLEAPSALLYSAAGGVPQVSKAARLALLSIGQGEVVMTPLHVACMTAAVAADGAMMRPRLLESEPGEKIVQLFAPKVAGELQVMMRAAVTDGTGRGINIPGMGVCGKTGTAQVPHGDDHAWFTCFAPQKRAGVVITVLVENGGFGAAAALPIARELMVESERLGYLKQ